VRRALLLLPAVALGGLLLAGCQSTPDSTPDPAPDTAQVANIESQLDALEHDLDAAG
jgi:outer membrane murein-binding lipoprotein Lpp